MVEWQETIPQEPGYWLAWSEENQTPVVLYVQLQEGEYSQMFGVRYHADRSRFLVPYLSESDTVTVFSKYTRFSSIQRPKTQYAITATLLDENK